MQKEIALVILAGVALPVMITMYVILKLRGAPQPEIMLIVIAVYLFNFVLAVRNLLDRRKR